MQNKKPIILAFVRYYLPGYKSGGPIRTIANMVDHLGDQFDFKIITSDRDATDQVPYSQVVIDGWNRVEGADVYYASPTRRSIRDLARLVSATSHDILYLNSFFDPVFTLKPLLAKRMGWLPVRPVVVAPRGEFSPGALALKRWKKVPYLVVVQTLGLYRNVVWQVSSEHEAMNLQRVVRPPADQIVVAPNLPPRTSKGIALTSIRQLADPLRVVFLSRISPMKNLEFALRVLAIVKTPVLFNIYGPIRDAGYWAQCQSLIQQTPPHVQIHYLGSLTPDQVPGTIATHDLFFLPTRGENYGHVIAEALTTGTPVLIADTTPWRDLEKAGVGWDLPLQDATRFAACIDHCAAFPAADYSAWRERIRTYATARLTDTAVIEANQRLFSSLI
ncbi:MAG TPA: glycosyltransferase family 4 protein [Candidatus Competibacter sp.]|nr:glycosyltransferase family 4 protein [Candidatus Competibacter sp.]